MASKKIIALVCIFLLLTALASALCISSDDGKKAANLEPTVRIEADVTSGLPPLTVNFKADAEDLDGFVDTFNWDFDDGTTSNKEKVIHTFNNPGSYNVTLTVKDNNAAEAEDTIGISVNELVEPNEPPTATATVEPSTARVQEELNFVGSGEDRDGWIAKFEWDFDGNGVFDWNSSTTGVIQYALNTSGSYTAVFQVTDDDGATATASVSFEIQPRENNPPVAVISQPEDGAIFDSGEEIQFDGSESSDPDGDTLEFFWDFGDGDVAYEAKPTHTYTTDGNYTIQLTVGDGLADVTDSISLQIITVENHAPVAEISSPQQDEAFDINTVVFFDGTNSSDPDGDFIYYYWDFGDGSYGTGASTTHIYTAVGTYIVLLTVDDGDLTGSDSVRISITDQGTLNQPPEAVINEPENGDNFTTEEVITFSGENSSDPDGDDLNYTWAFQDGTLGYGEVTTHQYSENGTYNVTLTVFDGQYSDTASVVVIIGPAVDVNTPPTAVISEPTMLSSHETNQSVTCAGYQSFDPEGKPLTYDWNFGDSTEHSNEMNTTHRYTTEGVYLIRLTVSDGVHNDTDSVVINIVEGTSGNSAPTAEIVAPSTGQTFAVNEVITFDGSNSSDPENDTLTYTWYFGDGTTGTGMVTTHKYSSQGLYIVTLEVSDGQLNDTDRVTIIITIQFRSASESRGDDDSSAEDYSRSIIAIRIGKFKS
ncbi:PKD domain-containing protein [[Eubacterium] cellulosolvens]